MAKHLHFGLVSSEDIGPDVLWFFQVKFTNVNCVAVFNMVYIKSCENFIFHMTQNVSLKFLPQCNSQSKLRIFLTTHLKQLYVEHVVCATANELQHLDLGLGEFAQVWNLLLICFIISQYLRNISNIQSDYAFLLTAKQASLCSPVNFKV